MFYNFEQDLARARKTEKRIREAICDKYGFLFVADSITKYWDFKLKRKLDGREFTFEVKEDLIAWKTEMVAIEFESRYRPSGISTTKADWWIYRIVDTDEMGHLDLMKTLI